MNATLLAVALSLVSAVAYAAAAVAQERLASRTAGTDSGILRLLGTGAWWGSVLLNASAALLHVAALKYGPLTLVQPLGALTLVAAVPLGARMAGRRVLSVEWRGTALTLAGLGALLLTASGPAPEDTLSLGEALAVAGATAALIGLLSRRGAKPGLRHATASGLASGIASALAQTVTVAVTDRTGPLLSVKVVVVALLIAAFAAGGLLLSQVAYRGGLGAPSRWSPSPTRWPRRSSASRCSASGSRAGSRGSCSRRWGPRSRPVGSCSSRVRRRRHGRLRRPDRNRRSSRRNGGPSCRPGRRRRDRSRPCRTFRVFPDARTARHGGHPAVDPDAAGADTGRAPGILSAIPSRVPRDEFPITGSARRVPHHGFRVTRSPSRVPATSSAFRVTACRARSASSSRRA